MQLLGILLAAAILVGIVVLYYHYFDPMHIEEEADEEIGKEDAVERARVIAKHQEEIEEQKIEETADMYSEQ